MKPKLFTTIVGYTTQQFAADAIAGITVALVPVPLSIAIAIASSAPPAAGLITAVVAGSLISALGGSRVQIRGPTGAFIVVVYRVIAKHGYEGLLVSTFMAGAILSPFPSPWTRGSVWLCGHPAASLTRQPGKHQRADKFPPRNPSLRSTCFRISPWVRNR